MVDIVEVKDPYVGNALYAAVMQHPLRLGISMVLLLHLVVVVGIRHFLVGLSNFAMEENCCERERLFITMHHAAACLAARQSINTLHQWVPMPRSWRSAEYEVRPRYTTVYQLAAWLE